MTRDLYSDQAVHASAVALDGRCVLIFGPAGSGKSALALGLMAIGCALVSDDYTVVSARDDLLWAKAPDAIRNRIEARGVGILAAEAVPGARVVLAVDLGITEANRLPPERQRNICGQMVPLLHNIAGPHFPAAILQYLKAGRVA